MIRKAGREVLEGLRAWQPIDGGAPGWMREMRSAAGGLPRRMRERASAAWPSPGSGGIRRLHPGPAILAAAGAILAMAGILLYLRKRRQVAAHYTMGEGDAAWGGGRVDSLLGAEASRY